MPYAFAMEVLLTGDLFSAERAFQVGLVNHVVPRAGLMDKALDLARKVSANGPYAVRQVRRSARECIGRPVADALRLESELAAGIYATKDAQEGPRAFAERRRPNFVGA